MRKWSILIVALQAGTECIWRQELSGHVPCDWLIARVISICYPIAWQIGICVIRLINSWILLCPSLLLAAWVSDCVFHLLYSSYILQLHVFQRLPSNHLPSFIYDLFFPLFHFPFSICFYICLRAYPLCSLQNEVFLSRKHFHLLVSRSRYRIRPFKLSFSYAITNQ